MTLPIEVVVGRDTLATTKLAYSPSKIVLYGVYLYQLEATIGGAAEGVAAVSVNVVPTCPGRTFMPALVYAFAYQGHCYNLPEPTLLIVQGKPAPAEGFGFDNTGYKMWQVEKLDRTMQLEMTNDTFEEIALKRMLQGTKQPLSYASRAAISHRGGKLSE